MPDKRVNWKAWRVTVVMFNVALVLVVYLVVTMLQGGFFR